MEKKRAADTEMQIVIRWIVGGQESTVQVDHFPFLIGRDSASVQLALPDATVSRVHARVIYQDGAVLLENISTTNKTAVNGKVISGLIEVNDGDQVVMGSCHLIFEIERSAEPEGPLVSSEKSTAEGMIAAKMSSGEDTAEKSSAAPKIAKPQVNYCQKCGKKLIPGSAFCGGCGTAVSTEIKGQPIFCGDCGAKLSGDSHFCPYCGIPTILEKRSAVGTSPGASALTKNSQRPQKNGKKNIIPVIAVAAVLIAAIAGGVLLFGGRSYTKVVDQYVDAIFGGNITKLWNLFPSEVQNAVLEELEDYLDIEDVKEALGYLEDTMAYISDELEDEFGKNWTYSYEIIGEDDYSRRQIAALEDELRDEGIRDLQIDAAKEVELEITIGSRKDNRSFTQPVEVIKVGRSWYLWYLQRLY